MTRTGVVDVASVAFVRVSFNDVELNARNKLSPDVGDGIRSCKLMLPVRRRYVVHRATSIPYMFLIV